MLLRNTLRDTGVRGGGDDPHRVPGEVAVDLEARLLPGFGLADVVSELGSLGRGLGVRFEVLRYDPGPPPQPDTGLFPVLARIQREADP